ncbi:RagB/SusD family nutrient uptake outer membrane protein [Sphingobacterium sp. lm-10]|uniref:RagB/SusD family nutrient uptake outer membrane protein n=1 Tax=Sphingobacterium sp. lm-10 TaxID=2944904 RepID=UPI002020D8C1|nr:RagB/SusD family nutrient uptake outer membrane protein [Sphingobacterium sp. lm-10]MCL7987966.1 RagB/SusD family nutrient uptake outer membrane protein [Sphingobacterium sp. lm-10]
MIHKYITKQSSVLLPLIIAFSILSGCSQFIELQPLDNLSEEVAFDTPGNIELAINGVYRAATIGEFEGGGGRGFPFGSASIQQGEMRGEDMINLQQSFTTTYEGAHSTVSVLNKNHWEQLYKMINEANVFIDGVRRAVENGVIVAEVALAYEGEARFLRALAHHELLLHFSRPFADDNGNKPGVPYRTVAITSNGAIDNNVTVGRGTVAAAYENILVDLDFAEINLPNTRAVVGVSISRATSGAAIALKTRIKLHQQDYSGVIAEANKLGAIGTSNFSSPIGAYTLSISPDEPFVNNGGNSESIFSFAMSGLANPGVTNSLSSTFGASTANPDPGASGGRNQVSTSPILWNVSYWLEDDLRRTLLHFRQVNSDGGYRLVYNNKYRSFLIFSDWAPILRYAEVLLNASEAHARLGNNAQSLSLLNAVRDRSVPNGASFGTTAPEDLIQAVLNEQRIEFAGEGRRWPNIHRLALDATYGTNGIPAKIEFASLDDQNSFDLAQPPNISRNIVALPYNSNLFLWPIPESEVLSNPTLAAEQNPGY